MRGVAPESQICLCARRLVNPIFVNLLFIGSGKVSIVWGRFLDQDCVIKHGFVSGENWKKYQKASRIRDADVNFAIEAAE